LVLGQAPDGSPLLSVLGKKTYRFAHGEVAYEDGEDVLPLFEEDAYYDGGDPSRHALKWESDLIAYKARTDFAVVGLAHAPPGRKAFYLDVGLQVGSARKMVRVFGDRRVEVRPGGIAFSEPEAFLTMPLHFGRAYGGVDRLSESGVTQVYPRNPVGKGFIVKDTPAALQDLELPNLEDPVHLLTPENLILGRMDQWTHAPKPHCFGFAGKVFHHRIQLGGMPFGDMAGVEVERLRKMSQAGSAPSPSVRPMHPSANNAAAEGLAFPYLRGDEEIKLAHMDKTHSAFRFFLPGEKPQAYLDLGKGMQILRMVPQTVTLHKETNQVTLVWQGGVRYAGGDALAEAEGLDYGVETVRG
jgi:hypothetical protein